MSTISGSFDSGAGAPDWVEVPHETVPETPPAHWGSGVSPKSDTLIFAGQKGWLPLSINLVPTETLVTHWEAVEEGAQQAGRTADRSEWRIAKEIYVGGHHRTGPGRSIERHHRTRFPQVLHPADGTHESLGLFKGDREMPDEAVTPEYLIDNVWIVGSVNDVTEKLRQLYSDVGGFGVLLAMGHEWEPKDNWVKSMSLLSQEVMPRLADLT